jgi:hypothetical protein
MTKEQLYVIWTLLPELKADIDAVIAYEIAKAKGVEKPALNPIEQAYEQWLKVRPKKWDKGHWIKKYDNLHWIHSNGVMQVKIISLFENPHDWELYTEAEAEKPAPAKPKFDQERFEAMFRAVVASGRTDNEFIETEEILEQLDAYYASKKGGENE